MYVYSLAELGDDVSVILVKLTENASMVLSV